jgi:hypothetical protein
MESFEAKPPDLAALEVGLMGAARVCSRQSARLAAKCHGGTFKLSVPYRQLPSKVVSRHRMARPMSCSSRLSLRFIAAAASGHSDVSGEFLWPVCYKDVEALCDCVGCHE